MSAPDIVVRLDMVTGGACAPKDATVEQVAAAANAEPSGRGASVPWKVEGEPLTCFDDAGRQHWRLVL